MNILCIIPNPPSLVRVRPYNLIKPLRARGNQVTVAQSGPTQMSTATSNACANKASPLESSTLTLPKPYCIGAETGDPVMPEKTVGSFGIGVQKWLSLDTTTKFSYARLLIRGWFSRHHFVASRYPLIGNHVWLNHPFGSIHLGSFVTISDGAGLSVFGRDREHIASLSIGDYTNIGPRTHINCSLSISIGKHCAISWDCEILDTDIHTIVFRDGTRSSPSPVVIEDRVWLGTRSLVLKGVRIGEGSVIGAGSVVTQDIPPHTLAVGNPARPLKAIQVWSP